MTTQVTPVAGRTPSYAKRANTIQKERAPASIPMLSTRSQIRLIRANDLRKLITKAAYRLKQLTLISTQAKMLGQWLQRR